MNDAIQDERGGALGNAFGIFAAFLLVAIIVGGLAYSQGREVERRDQTKTNSLDAAKQEALRVCAVGAPAAVFECVVKKLETNRQEARAEQDLNAQQGMKFWAAVMACLTAITVLITAIGVWLVKQTLDATLEAVKDTSHATKAMIRQNELAEATQRAWIEIDLKVRRLEVWDETVNLDYELVFRNIGQTIARNIWVNADVVIDDYRFQKEAEDIRERWGLPKGPSQIALMPNESKSHLGMSSWNVGEMPWPKSDNPRVNLIVVAQAIYLTEGKQLSHERSETFRAFRIGVEGVNFLDELSLRKSELEYSGLKSPVIRTTNPSFTS